MSTNELAFGEVELGDECRVVITRQPGICEPAITLSLQRLHDRRYYTTEQEIVLGATAAQSMADIVTAFVRGEPSAAREPQATEPFPDNRICRPAPYPQIGAPCPKCGKRWSGVYQRDADTIMALCNGCGNAVTWSIAARPPQATREYTETPICPLCHHGFYPGDCAECDGGSSPEQAAERPLDTTRYHAARGEPSAREGWVWVLDEPGEQR